MNLILIISTLLSSLSAVFAWIAKIWWSKEQIDAKNEIICSKEEQIKLLKYQIETYKELTPMRIREYFNSVKIQLEEYNDALKNQLTEAKIEIENQQRKINDLGLNSDKKCEEFKMLQENKDVLESKVNILQNQVRKLKSKSLEEITIEFKMPPIDPQLLEDIRKSSEDLRSQLKINSHKIDYNKLLDLQKEYSILWRSFNVFKFQKQISANGN